MGNNSSRVDNSIRNIIISVLDQVLTLVMSFVSRTVFIHFLGKTYLGVNGLYTNILTVLSLAELGIGSAMVYSMYKPLRENDTKKLQALINYYRFLYHRIAVIVAVVGVLLIPFLDRLITLDQPLEHYRLYYILFLINSVTSYLFVYKTSILTADQKEYKLKICNAVFQIVRFATQVLVLVLTKSFLLYLVAQILTGILQNVVASKIAEKNYPYIRSQEKLDENEKNKIWKNIRSLFAYQVGNVALNGTDNILISAMVGTITVGLYSNYTMIINSVSNFTSMVFTSLQASVGNLNASNDRGKQIFIFKVLNLMSFWLFGFCAVCFSILFQDFLTLWVGEEFCLPNAIPYICAFNFYVAGILYPVFNYRTTIGLFQHTKVIMFFAAGLNLFLSFVLGKIWGLSGILVATGLARLMTNFWFEPYKLYKIYFKKSSVEFFRNQLFNMLLVTCIIALIKIGFDIIYIDMVLVRFLAKMIVCIIVPNCIFFVVYRKKDEYQYLKQIVKTKFLKIVHKGV